MTRFLSLGSKLSLLLCLSLLVPRVGVAAAVLIPEPSGLPGTSEPAPLRLSDDPLAQKPERPRAPRALRILAETGAGLVTSVGFAAVGVLVGNELCHMPGFGPIEGPWGCLDEEIIGGFVGIGLGLPLGIFLGGELTGGDGKLYGPVLGVLAGVAVGLLVSVALNNYTGFLGIALPFMLVGSIVGYELTTRPAQLPQPPMAPAVASSRPRLQPVLAVSSRGALLGLGGSF